MRILHIASHLNIGGITRYLLGLATRLARRHEVMVAADTGELRAEFQQAHVAHWPVPLQTSAEFSPRVWQAAQHLSRRLRREPVDVLHAHTRVGQVVAACLSRRLRIPYVATWHGIYRMNLGRRLWPCAGDRTIAISQPVREHLLRDIGVPASRI